MVAAPSYPPRYSLRRVSQREPCPICSHTKGCEIRADGAVNCIRTDSPHPSNRLGGHWHRLPERDADGRVQWRPEDFAPRDESPAPPPEPGPAIADAATRHAVYTSLLELCPLSPTDRAHLTGPKRQIAPEDLGGYGTLPPAHQQAPIMAGLVRAFGRDVLLTVPGFIDDQNVAGGLRLATSGLLIPVRDVAGRIQGFQVRQLKGGYLWLSSARHGGPGSGAPAHVARPHVVRDSRVYVTEGPLKADIAAARLGAVVVGVAGHANWKTGLPILESLQADGCDVVVIALDADDPAKPTTVRQVEASRQALAAEACALGYAVRLARWDHAAGKGIDDLLLSGGTYAPEVYHPHVAALGADDDDHAAGLDPGPLSDSRKLRMLSNVLLNKTMKTTEKVTLCVTYLLTGIWPGTQPPTDDGYRKPLATIAARANIGRSTVSRSMSYLKDQGLANYDQRTEMPPPLTFPRSPDAPPPSATPKTVTYFKTPRALGFDEALPEAGHRVADRTRRCPACGGTHLKAKTLVCLDCDSVCTVTEAEQAAADSERNRHAREQATARDATTEAPMAAQEHATGEPPTQNGCADSAHLSVSGESVEEGRPHHTIGRPPLFHDDARCAESACPPASVQCRESACPTDERAARPPTTGRPPSPGERRCEGCGKPVPRIKRLCDPCLDRAVTLGQWPAPGAWAASA